MTLKGEISSQGVFLLFSTFLVPKVRFASFLSRGFTSMAVINLPEKKLAKHTSVEYTEVRFACFLSDGFITAIVVNPPGRKLAK